MSSFIELREDMYVLKGMQTCTEVQIRQKV